MPQIETLRNDFQSVYVYHQVRNSIVSYCDIVVLIEAVSSCRHSEGGIFVRQWILIRSCLIADPLFRRRGRQKAIWPRSWCHLSAHGCSIFALLLCCHGPRTWGSLLGVISSMKIRPALAGITWCCPTKERDHSACFLWMVHRRGWLILLCSWLETQNTCGMPVWSSWFGFAEWISTSHSYVPLPWERPRQDWVTHCTSGSPKNLRP